ncbi:hypothetical protein [Georgenia subflava]|uniref:Uncharacterized protein n=1 Tax=Georgenia subflava TaxID=1622177 RepID=A0A6N7ENC6_9MICO|nr:hypothetical protein [Georgenia subflava]MPV36714.1 hypothetical protein [Georgenia subflava]
MVGPADPVYDVIVQSDALDYWTAFGTVAAVLVALTFGAVELFRWSRERGERRRDQAQHIAAWREVFVDGPNNDTDVYSVKTHMANTSALPVFDARFYYTSFVHDEDDWVERTWNEAALLPGQHVHTDWEHQQGNPGGGRLVEVTFRDAAGRWWRRDREGTLTELSAKPPGK